VIVYLLRRFVCSAKGPMARAVGGQHGWSGRHPKNGIAFARWNFEYIGRRWRVLLSAWEYSVVGVQFATGRCVAGGGDSNHDLRAMNQHIDRQLIVFSLLLAILSWLIHCLAPAVARLGQELSSQEWGIPCA
jgi:hypothetical protein